MLGHFVGVRIGETSLDYRDTDQPITQQHYAFLVSEAEFDQVFARIRERDLEFWADPRRRRRGEINTWDDGRGCYFDDPNGHLLEIITRPYGSGGTTASNPHPLIAAKLKLGEHESGLAQEDGERGGGAPAGRERPDQRHR